MILPLMPKGVEHKLSISEIVQFAAVILPLMPKGVEHSQEVVGVDQGQ